MTDCIMQRVSDWNYESISLTNKQQSMVLFVIETLIKSPDLLFNFGLHGKQGDTYVYHNEEISNIYNTLKEQVSKNIEVENTLQKFIKLSPEDRSKVLTQLQTRRPD